MKARVSRRQPRIKSLSNLKWIDLDHMARSDCGRFFVLRERGWRWTLFAWSDRVNNYEFIFGYDSLSEGKTRAEELAFQERR
jgi:hypothetical protein